MRTLFLILLFSVFQSAFAIDAIKAPEDNIQAIEAPSHENGDLTSSELESSEIKMLRINNEFWSVLFLCILCVVILIVVLSFLKMGKHTAKDIVNVTGLTLIIFGTIILVLVVNTSEQLTAAIGILGAIAGYLFRSVQEGDGKA